MNVLLKYDLWLLVICFFFISLSSCNDFTEYFRNNIAGTYSMLDGSGEFYADITGDLAGASGIRLTFYRAISDYKAIYFTKTINTPKKYIGIVLSPPFLYATPFFGTENVSFDSLSNFAEKIS